MNRTYYRSKIAARWYRSWNRYCSAKAPESWATCPSSIRGRSILGARHIPLRPQSSALRGLHGPLKLCDELLAQQGRSTLAGILAANLRCAVTHFLRHPFASLRLLLCREITSINGRPFSTRFQSIRDVLAQIVTQYRPPQGYVNDCSTPIPWQTL